MAVRRLAPLLVVLGLLALSPITPLRAAPGPAVGEGTVVGFGASVGVSPTAPGPALDDLVSVASTPSGLGWWAVAGDGKTASAGDATPLGVTPSMRAPVVSIVASPVRGAWLASADGGVFALGGATFAGSAGALRLRSPIVGMAATPSGRGYWLVAGDGGVFTYGDARFHGSAGALPLRSPIVGMAATPSGRGYWLVAGDGGVFTYGDAAFAGAGADGTTSIAPTSRGGYWLLTGDGAVRGFGAAAAHRGDLAGRVPDAVAVSLTPVGGLGGAGYRIGVGRVRDVLTIWQPGGLGAAAEAWARDVAARAGGRTSLRHRANVDLPAPDGWRIPLTLTAVEPGIGAPLVGPSATAALGRGEAVLGRAAATLRSASVGSTIQLLARDGRVHTRRVGALVDDGRIAWSEVALATTDAASLGIARPFAIDVWGASRGAIDDALRSGPRPPTALGVERSWSVPSPDGTLPSAQLKQRVGEVAYRPAGSGDAVALDPAWVRANIVTEPVPALGSVTCHRAVMAALRSALTEVVRAGLAGTLGRFGGCYNPRLIRGGDSGGILSRHSYGIAIDVNTSRNTFGGRVELDGRVVDIFRRWGFAWGGTWVRPDGMHLEWSP
jgi:hypothetical protein